MLVRGLPQCPRQHDQSCGADVHRGAKWGAKLHTHRRTATDVDGTQPSKSEGIWTFTNTNGRFSDALQAGCQGFDSPQLHQQNPCSELVFACL